VEHVLDVLKLFIPSQVKAVQSPTFIIFLSTASVGWIGYDSHGLRATMKEPLYDNSSAIIL